jgi:hypothetical protein
VEHTTEIAKIDTGATIKISISAGKSVLIATLAQRSCHIYNSNFWRKGASRGVVNVSTDASQVFPAALA